LLDLQVDSGALADGLGKLLDADGYRATVSE
jgi:hypothetical protein